MTYGSRPRRRRGAVPSHRWMNIFKDGECHLCKVHLNKGDLAFWDGSHRTLTCTASDCADAAGLSPAPVSGRLVLSSSRGRPTPTRSRFGRCEDAPCCGCCT